MNKRLAKTQKISVAVIAGITGLGTMFSMVPLSFADALPANNKNQIAASRKAGPARGLTGLKRIQSPLKTISMAASVNSLLLQSSAYQNQSSQQEVAESLQVLTKNLETVLQSTSYMSELQSVQGALEKAENALKTPNLPNSALEGSSGTQGELQNIVSRLQSIINAASHQYATELTNAANDYNETSLPATKAGVADAVEAAQDVHNMADSANSPDLSTALNTFTTDAGQIPVASGSTSQSSNFLGKAAVVKQNAYDQLANVQNGAASLYKVSSSDATGALAVEAKNFDSWAKSWIADANKSSGETEGYTEFLNAINAALSDISSWESDNSLKVGNSADAATVVTNLKIMKSAVQTLQNLMANCSTASLAPEKAYTEAMQDALNGKDAAFPSLQSFIQGAMPITPQAQGGKSGQVPSEVEGYGDYAAWPANNPFTGSKATQLWTDLSQLQSKALNHLPSMDLQTSDMSGMRTSWPRDLANYEYFQAQNRYMEVLAYDANQTLDLAEEAGNKIKAAENLAEQNTGTADSDSSASSQARQDIQDALADMQNADSYGTSVTQAMEGTYQQYASATSSTPSVTMLKPLAPGGISVEETVHLPTQTTESPLYTQQDATQTESSFNSAITQIYRSLSGSDSGNGQGGLLSDAAAWQKAVVTQGVFNQAQDAYNAIQKVEQDLDAVKAASDPGKAVSGLNLLQSDLTPLVESAQDALNGMTSGNQALHALGQAEPYSASDISNARTPMASALLLASDSNPANPIQKAIKDGAAYNSGQPIATGMSGLEPAARALIGEGNEGGEAQKVLSLPFKTAPAASVSPKAAPSEAPSQAPEPAPSQAPSSPSPVTIPAPSQAPSSPSQAPAPAPARPASFPQRQPAQTMPAVKVRPMEKTAPQKALKPVAKSKLAFTGSNVEAAVIGAAALLAAGIVAELLKRRAGAEGK